MRSIFLGSIARGLRRALPIVVAGLSAFLFVTPCLAIEPPDRLEILGVWAYRNCREAGDQLYLVEYSLNYTSLPAETASEAYVVRLMKATGELGATQPSAYHNKGYGLGVAAIYFDADDAPSWAGAYTMKLMGNPFLAWNGTIPETSYTPFDVWQDNPVGTTRIVVSGRITYLAGILEADWGEDLVTTSQTGQTVLTAKGQAYFASVIGPYFFEIAPDLFLPGTIGSIEHPGLELPPEQERTGYADTLERTIIGTPLDVTPVANIFGVSRGVLTAILYYGMVLVVLAVVAQRLGSYRPVMLIGGFLMIAGSFVGVPLIVAILGGLMGAGMIGWTLFYKPSGG